MTPLQAAAVDAAVWAVWGTAVGYAGSRLPAGFIARDTALTRLRAVEAGGQLWERVGVRRWKDRLPEAGALFGGASKRRIGSLTPDGLVRFGAETRRAEYVHWAVPAALPVMALWNPPWLLAAMGVYAVAANGPCLVVQRYNRARVERLLARRATATATAAA